MNIESNANKSVMILEWVKPKLIRNKYDSCNLNDNYNKEAYI